MNTPKNSEALPPTNGSVLSDTAENKELLEIGRRAIEAALSNWRDSRLSEPFRGNGLVIREKDGGDSSVIRFGPETALRIGLKAMAEHFSQNTKVSRAAQDSQSTPKP